MRNVADSPPSAKCDTTLRNLKTRGRGERQKRFLDAYRQRPTIAVAARLTGVHRATIYRWMEDDAFADAVQAANEVFLQNCREKWLEQQAARRLWRQERERERRPMRCYYLARARAAKQQKKLLVSSIADQLRRLVHTATHSYNPGTKSRP